ncbi:MAG: nuclear transport factor 2 family protein [Deltaproteobacteria bacterium]|nr:nuclear transport factor 2 family protein [Deltaproteobacteria bacterium]
MSEDLEPRLQRLEDVDAVGKLKALYCSLADAAYRNPAVWDELLEHFDENAWLDFGAFGVYRGKVEVARFFKEVSHSFVSYAAHMVANQVIEVAGSSATGRWYFFCPSTSRGSNRALWIQGRYEDTFVKRDGRWRWQSITARFDFVSPFEEGWAKTPMFGG